MPAHRLSEIVPRIDAASDPLALEACVAEGLAAFGVSADALQRADPTAMAGIDSEQRAYADIILGIARIRALSLSPSRAGRASRLRQAGLTDRQIEAPHWAAAGKANGAAAAMLGESRRAVDYHMSEILRKLRVTSRAQAIACAARD